MPTKQRTQDVISLIKKSLRDNDKSEFYKLTLEELREVNANLGFLDKDSSYRIVLQDRIKALENLELNKKVDDKYNQNLNIGWEKEIKGWARKKKNALVHALNPEWNDLYQSIC